MTLTASPPSEVSLHVVAMSAPVSRMVAMAWSSETTCSPPPASAIRTAFHGSSWPPYPRSGQRLETQPTRRVPHVEVADRSVVIRPYKLVGRLLDPAGFATGVVPLDLGSAPTRRSARSE